MAKDTYTKINELADELGTAESHRQALVQEVSDLEEELDAIDAMAETATTRDEYNAIMGQRKECELDLRFARNRLNRFDMSPRIAPETLADLLGQLSADADAAASRYRQKVEKPLAALVAAGDEFDATIDEIREAVSKLRSVQGPMAERDRAFDRFEPYKLRSRAYCDGTIVHPGLRDALNLASSAKWPSFDTH